MMSNVRSCWVLSRDQTASRVRRRRSRRHSCLTARAVFGLSLGRLQRLRRRRLPPTTRARDHVRDLLLRRRGGLNVAAFALPMQQARCNQRAIPRQTKRRPASPAAVIQVMAAHSWAATATSGPSKASALRMRSARARHKSAAKTNTTGPNCTSRTPISAGGDEGVSDCPEAARCAPTAARAPSAATMPSGITPQ